MFAISRAKSDALWLSRRESRCLVSAISRAQSDAAWVSIRESRGLLSMTKMGSQPRRSKGVVADAVVVG